MTFVVSVDVGGRRKIEWAPDARLALARVREFHALGGTEVWVRSESKKFTIEELEKLASA